MASVEVGHPQHLAFGWHGISMVGRLRDLARKPGVDTAFWFAWEVVGLAWSVANLYRISAERLEGSLEAQIREELHRLRQRPS